MNKQRARIVLLTLVAFSIFLILYRLGDFGKKLEEQEKSLDSAVKSINSSISKLKNSGSGINSDSSENLTAEIVYELEIYNKDDDSIKANFTIYPRQIQDSLKVSLASDDKVIKLKRDGISFKGSHVYKFNDTFLNLVTYFDNDIVKIDKLSGAPYGSSIGSLVVPTIKIETKDEKSIFTEGSYTYQAVSKYSLEDSEVKIIKDDNKRYSNFKSLELNLEVNGFIRDTKNFEINKHDFNESFNDISLKYKATEKDAIKVYLKAVDDLGLEHIVVLEQINMSQEDSKPRKVYVYGKQKGIKIYEYSY